jgi:hypothetical protein
MQTSLNLPPKRTVYGVVTYKAVKIITLHRITFLSFPSELKACGRYCLWNRGGEVYIFDITHLRLSDGWDLDVASLDFGRLGLDWIRLDVRFEYIVVGIGRGRGKRG